MLKLHLLAIQFWWHLVWNFFIWLSVENSNKIENFHKWPFPAPLHPLPSKMLTSKFIIRFWGNFVSILFIVFWLKIWLKLKKTFKWDAIVELGLYYECGCMLWRCAFHVSPSLSCGGYLHPPPSGGWGGDCKFCTVRNREVNKLEG